MLVLNGGMPRSGTTWVLNVADSLFDLNDLQLLKVNANNSVEVNNAVAEHQRRGNKIIHFHAVSEAALRVSTEAYCRTFYNYRDPRDIVVSQMTLHEAPFQAAVQMTIAACQHFTMALKVKGLRLISYADIVNRPTLVVNQVAEHLGFQVTRRDAASICERTCVEKHRSIMDDLNNERISAGSTFTGRRSIRYDPNSFITDRHIQSGKIGRWKDELTQEQQLAVNETFASFSLFLSLLDTDAEFRPRIPDLS